MVLYHCCMSLDVARDIERTGFDPDALVRVTERMPNMKARVPRLAFGRLSWGPFGFSVRRLLPCEWRQRPHHPLPPPDECHAFTAFHPADQRNCQPTSRFRSVP